VAGDERLATLIEPEIKIARQEGLIGGGRRWEQEGDGGLHGQVNRT
jgi:hypothetical protein